MRIAVINEVSAAVRNGDILAALERAGQGDVVNVGMGGPEQQPALTYIHTGLMAALLLDCGAVDMVIGGCGTGQGFLNAAMQYPKVFCGLLLEPLDAWLFSQINGGNCVSLALNKGYGWAGELNLAYIFRELFRDPLGGGYPPQRSETQAESRRALAEISGLAHRDMLDILPALPAQITAPLGGSAPFLDALEATPGDRAAAILGLLRP